MAEHTGTIGDGISVKGEVTGRGTLVVDGEVEGRIIAPDRLTIGKAGTVRADIDARAITIHGRVDGGVTALYVELGSTARVSGELKAPSVVFAAGAAFRGKLHMELDLPDDV